LVSGELAINITDGKLYYKNNAGVVTLLASTSGAAGDVVGPASATDNALARFDLTTGKLIQNSVGILSDAGILTGLTGITSSGPITLSSLTSGRVTFASTGGLLADSANLTFNGNTLTSSNATGANAIFNSTTNVPYIRFDESGASKLLIGASAVVGGGAGYDFYGAAGIGLTFFTNTARRLDITSAGNVGIGTSSPDSFTTFPSKLVVGSGTGGQHITIYSGTASEGDLIFADGTTGTEQYRGTLRYDHADDSFKIYSGGGTLGIVQNASGNLGLGVTPSAWNVGKAVQIGAAGDASLWGYLNSAYLSSNAYYNGVWIYTATAAATQYLQQSGEHIWYTAPSGTAASGITFTERMRIDSSGNLLVGTTSALSQVARETVVSAGNAFVAQCGNGTTALQTTNTSGTSIYYPAIFGNNGNTFSTCGIISVSGSTTTYATASSNTTGAQLNASGIEFPATQIPSANANTLDDYEEGTWMLTLAGTSGSATVSSTARYTKIGNIVTLTAGFDWSSSTLAGPITIGGFPFNTSNVTANYRSAASFGYTAGVVFAGQLVSDAAANATTCAWLYLVSGTTPADVVLNSTGSGQFCFTYQVA
jgi:hypothetical protein